MLESGVGCTTHGLKECVMDADRFDQLARSLTEGATRRGIARALGGLSLTAMLGPLLGLADAEAKKKKGKNKNKNKNKKCKGGKKKCGKTCIPSSNCCTTADCDAGEACTNGACRQGCVPACEGKECGSDGCEGSCGSCEADESCQNGTCTPPNPCEGEPDLTVCGEWTLCDSPRGVCGDFCSGGVCEQIPTCNGSTDSCGVKCCDPAGASCMSFPDPNACGCSSVDYPCYMSSDCCSPGVCVGFVCQLP
jgi:hypothetical protein